MNIVTLAPYRVACLTWLSAPERWQLTVVCRATFRLASGPLALHEQQEYPNEDDNYWNDDPHRSLYSPSDMVPFKRGAEVMLVGHAFAPGRTPVRSLLARLTIGEIDKTIDVFGHRACDPNGNVRDAEPFVSVPLRYERARGGPGTWNPVGIPGDGDKRAASDASLPNLQPPGLQIRRASDVIPPIGFGPIAATWLERAQRLGRHRRVWSGSSWMEQPIPSDFDASFFNAAPPDQQLSALSPGAALTLHNLHTEEPQLSATLPEWRPQIFVDLPGASPKHLDVKADTLWIDTDRSLCALVWRATFPIASPSQQGRIVACVETKTAKTTWSEAVQALARESARTSLLADNTRPMPAEAETPKESTLPFAPRAGGSSPQISPSLQERLERLNQSSASAGETLSAGHMASHSPALPFPTSGAPVSQGDDRPLFPPPILAPPPPFVEPPPSAMAPPPVMIEPPPARVSRPENEEQGPWQRAGRRRIGASTPGDGAVALSNAAAAMSPWAQGAPTAEDPPKPQAPKAARRAPTTVLELIWFDAAVLPRIRRNPPWKKILASQKPRPKDEDSDVPKEKRQGGKDQRDICAIFKEATPLDGPGIEEALADAMEEGVFAPPLVLLSGELEFSFDPVETLKATVGVVSPFAATDRKLAEVLDAAKEMLQSPWLGGGGALCEATTDRLRDAFGESKRALPQGYLDNHVERMMLEQRRYYKRAVMGQAWIRGVLTPAGGGTKVVAYLPVALAEELPMFRRMDVRVVGELRLRVDQYEAAAMAMKVVGVGRVWQP